LGLSVGGDWSRYQSGCRLFFRRLPWAEVAVGRVLQGGSRIQSISGSVVLPRTQSYTRAQSDNCGFVTLVFLLFYCYISFIYFFCSLRINQGVCVRKGPVGVYFRIRWRHLTVTSSGQGSTAFKSILALWFKRIATIELEFQSINQSIYLITFMFKKTTVLNTLVMLTMTSDVENSKN